MPEWREELKLFLPFGGVFIRKEWACGFILSTDLLELIPKTGGSLPWRIQRDTDQYKSFSFEIIITGYTDGSGINQAFTRCSGIVSGPEAMEYMHGEPVCSGRIA